MPVSSTSMRTSPRSCRQRKRTQPSRVYLMAFDTRLLRICCTSEGSLCTQSVHSSTCSFRPLFAARLAKSLRSSVNNAATVKSVSSGLMAPDSSLLMSSRAFKSRDIAPMACSCCQSASAASGSVTIRRKRAIEKGEALEGLAQVVTGGGQKAALGQIGTIGFVARHDQLRPQRVCGRSRRARRQRANNYDLRRHSS